MQINSFAPRFAATIQLNNDIAVPQHVSPDQVRQRLNRFLQQDSLVRYVCATTSDDLILTNTVTGDGKTAFVIVSKRDNGELPEDLQGAAVQVCSMSEDAIVNEAHWLSISYYATTGLVDLNGMLNQFKEAEKRNSSGSQDSRSGVKGLARLAGMKELKTELQNGVIGPLRRPDLARQVGHSIPNGMLLYGPPGTGKTYTVDCLAEELGLPIFRLQQSEVGSKYAHETVKAIGELLTKARQNAPCIVQIDEIDAMLPKRSEMNGDQQHRSEEVTELLQQMNDAGKYGVLIVGTTNVANKLDPAAIRPGHLDKQIYVGPPDLEARLAALKFHMKGRQSRGIDYSMLAERTELYSQADLEGLVKAAAEVAFVRAEANDRKTSTIRPSDFEQALAMVPASVPKDHEKIYRTIDERGVVNAQRAGDKKHGMGFADGKEAPKIQIAAQGRLDETA